MPLVVNMSFTKKKYREALDIEYMPPTGNHEQTMDARTRMFRYRLCNPIPPKPPRQFPKSEDEVIDLSDDETSPPPATQETQNTQQSQAPSETQNTQESPAANDQAIPRTPPSDTNEQDIPQTPPPATTIPQTPPVTPYKPIPLDPTPVKSVDSRHDMNDAEFEDILSQIFTQNNPQCTAPEKVVGEGSSKKVVEDEGLVKDWEDDDEHEEISKGKQSNTSDGSSSDSEYVNEGEVESDYTSE